MARTDMLAWPLQVYNGPRWLVEAYADTLDGLTQVAVKDAESVNNIQLIIMGVEGGPHLASCRCKL